MNFISLAYASASTSLQYSSSTAADTLATTVTISIWIGWFIAGLIGVVYFIRR